MEEKQIVIRAEEYGLTEKQANEIELGFSPSIASLNELKPEYDTLLQSYSEITPLICERAKTLRLKFVKIRTNTDKIHKSLKAFYLAGGRYVDAWKNKQLTISSSIEDKLKEIETHFERIEAEKKEARKQQRLELLATIEHSGEGLDLLNIEDTVFSGLFKGLQLEYNERKAEEQRQKEEQERIEQERKAEEERIKEENKKLKEQQEKAEAERKQLEQKLKEEQDKAEKAKREQQEKAEKELREKQEAEREGDKGRLRLFFSVLKDAPIISDPVLKAKLGNIFILIDEICK